MKSSSPGSGNAIDKALAVLEALPSHNRIVDIAAHTGLPKSTVHRILQSLVARQFAICTGDGCYIGGPRILVLASQVMGRFHPAQRADAALRLLRDGTGYTVHFALLNGDEAVYAAKLEGRKPYQMPSRVGMSIQLHTTAIGKAILAQWPDDKIADFAARSKLTARTPQSITSLDALSAELAASRERGYAVDDEENEAGIRCIGAAVYGHTGSAVGGVSVSTITLEPWNAPVADLAVAVKEAAREISAVLGAGLN
ncbi:MAG: IclR family transcriptional regulator [Stackebrandtia sp.]